MDKNFIIRTLSGAILALILLGCMIWSLYTFLLVVLLITGISMYEFYRIASRTERDVMSKGHVLYPIFIGLLSVVLIVVVGYGFIAVKWLLVIMPLVFAFFVFEMFRRNERPLQEIGIHILGIVYIAIPMALYILLGADITSGTITYNYHFPICFTLLIWVNDVGAYLVGRSFGKHRLIERLSPKKSWEGFFGGIGLTMIASVILGHWFFGAAWSQWYIWFFSGTVVSLSAVCGDLVESMFKHSVNLKDSGESIPGHGGFLDRFDAMFLSLPFTYVIYRLFEGFPK